jgi:hypothetical protein
MSDESSDMKYVDEVIERRIFLEAILNMTGCLSTDSASRNFDSHASNFQQAAQKDSKARPAKFDELRRTFQYVEANRAKRNEAYEAFSSLPEARSLTPGWESGRDDVLSAPAVPVTTCPAVPGALRACVCLSK